jgi:SAM-dependent methyltransferase
VHATSFNSMKYLVHQLHAGRGDEPLRVLDVGSMLAEEAQVRCYRDIFQNLPQVTYTGLDVAPGRNVDIVALNPYNFPLASDSFDWVISGQAFEHIEFPWLTIREIARVLKPQGIAIIIAPSSGPEHRYPLDCWRYYPDGMRALAKWSDLECLHALTRWYETELFMWGDTIGIFFKPSLKSENIARPIVKIGDLQRHQYDSKMQEVYVDSFHFLAKWYRRLWRLAFRVMQQS